MFDKILIANRGEIACRIIKTARRMGVKTVAVYSQADADARHVRMADEAVLIGPPSAKESYLVGEKIIAAARETGAQAVHPGYGFLSENEDFCRACADAGLVFIGPPITAIHAMGSKSEAKKLMGAANVPLTPGYHGDEQSPAHLLKEADAIGYPVLIKAAAGGGGKGMRLVESHDDFDAALASCKREALASFGDEHVLVEKYITRPRHIEIQVFGDSFGDCVSLYERDCSVQRRHQKVLEEAPAPGMSEPRRKAMSDAAVAAAKAVGYIGAGTVEFIVNTDGAFYFMEMNTRLQVEHPVTEMITGLDLVEWQLRVASGEPLPLKQSEIKMRGHALEARIYAEDPDKGFLPSIGKLAHLQPPEESAHVRIDTGVEEGDSISPFYDPMIAKLIVWDVDRKSALQRMEQALAAYQIVGVSNNIAFLSRLVTAPAFATADLDTGLIERERAFLFPENPTPPTDVFFIAALAELLREKQVGRANSGNDVNSPWAVRDGWRLNDSARRTFVFKNGEEKISIAATYEGDAYRLSLGERAVTAQGRIDPRGNIRAALDGLWMDAAVIPVGELRHIFLEGKTWRIPAIDPLYFADGASGAHGGLVAPMPGKVIALLAKPGEMLEQGAPILILEAMKMEHMIAAPSAGLLKSYYFAVGDQVTDGVELVEFEASN